MKEENSIKKILNLIMNNFFKTITIFLLLSFFIFYIAASESESNNYQFFFSKKNSYNKDGELSDNFLKKETSDLKDDDIDYSQFIENVVSIVKEDYVEKKSNRELIEAAAGGILSSLDPHSSYLNKKDLEEMQVQTSGEFGGLGIEITMEHSLVKIISPIEGTPAQKAGIKPGDYISKIEGKSVVGLKISDVVDKLRGKPGTKVNITILRKGEEAPFDLVLTREKIKIKAVRSSIEEDVAYIKINSFSEQAYVGVKSELEKLISEIGRDKIKGIVLDLRNNPGGLLEEAIRVSDLFLDDGQTIVSISGRDKSEEKFYKDSSNQILTKNIPIAILINEGSASASEIVAGALQDNKRAVVLGSKSFGKGSVQTIIPLQNGEGALKMTTALYYTPSGTSIQASGIEPDILVSEAKIEKVEKNGEIRSESSLEGHLKSQIEKEISSAKKDKLEDNLALYDKDYQLARAVDLLRGISVYKKINK